MNSHADIDTVAQWRKSLCVAAANHADLFNHIHVVAEVGSTQDEARRVGAQPGTIMTALRQTAGRGRHGRTWADTRSLGTATSFVLPLADRRSAAIITLAAAVAAARTVDTFLPAGVLAHIKWPNDIIVDRRKIAGILTEARDDLAVVGIGINVLQETRDWPADLAGHVNSLKQAGAVDPDRLAVVATLIDQMGLMWHENEDDLIRAFSQRDALRGAQVHVRCGSETVEGEMIEIDPLRHLLISTSAGRVRRIAADRASIDAACGPLIHFGD